MGKPFEENKLAFLIFKPDAVKQNLERSMWNFLEARGIRLLKQKYGMITREKRKDLYRDFHLNSRTNWALGTKFYELGPALFLIVYGDYPTDLYTSLSAYLSAMKGHFVAHHARPGTIRGEFNAINPVFNLIHTSDDQEASRREMRIFFDDGELSQLFPPKAVGRLNLGEKESLSLSLLNFYDLLLTFLQKLVGQTDLEEMYKQSIVQRLANGQVEINASSLRREKRDKLLSVLDEVSEQFPQATRPVPEGIGEWLRYQEFPTLDFELLFAKCELLGFYFDDWMRYLLITSLYYLEFE